MTSPQPATRRRIAFVLPVLDEAANLSAFHAALGCVLRDRPDLEPEFVYVDDGSRDGSLDLLVGLREEDDRVTVVSLSRNFGHQVAVTAGLDLCADADAVITMDTDLQDPPGVCLELIRAWEHGADVVFAQRRSRQDPVFKRATAYGFYWLLEKMAEVEIPRNVGDFRLLDARVVAEVSRYREHGRFLRGIVADVGFRQEIVLFDRDERHGGASHYPLRAMLALAGSALLGFSTAPLRWISRLGLVVSIVAVALAGYVAYIRLFVPERAVPGWAFLGVGLFLLGALQLVMTGVIGTYLARVYVETRDRPLYSVGLTARGPRSPERTREPADGVRNDPRP